MESCTMSGIKFFLFVFNLVFAISGIAIIAAGGIVLSDVGEFKHFLEGRILAPPVVLIVAGTIVFVVAFLGCYGAIKENYNMLIAFSVALLIIFIIELAVGIAAACFINDFSMAMKNSLKDSMEAYTESDKNAWNTVQTRLECCGVDGYKDWVKARALENNNLPSSCCRDIKANQYCESYQVSKIYEQGCFTALENRVKTGATVLIGVGIGIALIEIAGIILACLLASAIKKEERDK